ncbi:spore germination protein GerW family protein [Filibacter tadaridae]|uniref:Sporulation protein YtfJ (Spore_YtfJ) n=1 Tax=Filibacter tadaridae TaxID=2483811 RepID=A0A3P5XHP2_9BACL|nr:spore germination protein GerW family protein [Filibacter tadaridae]VDC28069.1 Sporulation protein YtfJ (Spore_YtfJ) [Filibacter tadaridae]
METEKTTNYQSPIGKLFEKFARQKDVSLVYGDPIEFINKKVLPVAKVNYMVGGGGGYSGESANSSVGQGEGGGGVIKVTPLGVYEINSKQVKFKPVIDFKFILTLVTILTLGLALLD